MSKGQKAVEKNVKEGNRLFEVRSNNNALGLKKGQIIRVDKYELKFKYKKEE